MTYVIPKFGELYADLNTPLPMTTRVLIATSNSVRNHLVLIVPVSSVRLLRSKSGSAAARGQQWLDELKLTAPIVGNLWTMFSMAQLSRTLATFCKAASRWLRRSKLPGRHRAIASLVNRSVARSCRSGREAAFR